jgi:heat shock protein
MFVDLFHLFKEGDKEKKKKQVLKSIELPIESLTAGFSQVEINQYTEQEFKMIAADRQEKERADARNAFEEYVYELRGKLSSDDELAPYILDSDRSALIKHLDDMENWLYDEGEECNRQVYQDKLAELKSKGEPIQNRKIEFELRPFVIEDFAKSLQLTMKALEQMKANDPKFAHLTDEDVKKVDQAFKQSYQWLEQTRQKSVNAPKHLAPPVTVAQIRQEKNEFESTVSPILNKPPPKAPSPPKEQQKSPAEEKTQQAQNAQEQQNQQQNQTQENMEWSSN